MPDRFETIAVFNAGSSSLKFSVYQGSAPYQGLIDRLESPDRREPRVITGSDRTKLFDGPTPARNRPGS